MTDCTRESGIAEALDRLEAELGDLARARIIAEIGGRRVTIPMPRNAPGSRLAEMIGLEAAQWLAEEYGGEAVDFPSRSGAASQERAARLLAAVLEAGLTHPTRSANDIADEFGVTRRRVTQLRQELRADPWYRSILPLFPDL